MWICFKLASFISSSKGLYQSNNRLNIFVKSGKGSWWICVWLLTDFFSLLSNILLFLCKYGCSSWPMVQLNKVYIRYSAPELRICIIKGTYWQINCKKSHRKLYILVISSVVQCCWFKRWVVLTLLILSQNQKLTTVLKSTNFHWILKTVYSLTHLSGSSHARTWVFQKTPSTFLCLECFDLCSKCRAQTWSFVIHLKWKENCECFSFSTECLRSFWSDHKTVMFPLIQIFFFNVVIDFLNIFGLNCFLLCL